VALLEHMGADLVVGCNPLPPPAPVEDDNPRSRLTDFLAEVNPVLRARDLGASFSLMLHSAGRAEPSATRILYDPPARVFPLMRTFRFDEARSIMAAVQREPGFVRVVERCAEAWGRLA